MVGHLELVVILELVAEIGPEATAARSGARGTESVREGVGYRQ